MIKRYKTISQLTDRDGIRYKGTTVYPPIPYTEDDQYVIAEGGDRYDILAQQFYSDQSLWWIIATANNTNKSSLTIPAGTQLRIPANPEKIVRDFKNLNNTR